MSGAQRGSAGQQHEVERALRELADAVQTLVLSVEAHYRPPQGCHVRADALRLVTARMLKTAQHVTSILDADEG